MKAVIPDRASAKLEFRIVPDQEPDVVLAQLRDHLDRHGFGDVAIEVLATVETARPTRPTRSSRSSSMPRDDVYGDAMVKPTEEYAGRQGAWLGRRLGIPGVQTGVGPPGARGHAADEFVTEEHFLAGSVTPPRSWSVMAGQSLALDVRDADEGLLPGIAGGPAGAARPRRRLAPGRQGEFVSVLGPSGCGKTTLARIIVGIEDRDQRARSTSAGARPGRPGPDRCLVFQNYGLLPWRTVIANVELGLELRGVPASERRAEAQQFIKLVGLTGLRAPLPAPDLRRDAAARRASRAPSRPSPGC